MRSGREPCLLLISPGVLKWTDADFGLPHLVSLGGYVRQRTGARVELLDLGYEGGDHRHLERVLDDLGPYLAIGVSCYSSFDYLRVMALARFLKGLYPEVPLVTGGYHASAVPGDLLFDGSPFDVVVPGEGERPLAELVEGLLGGAPPVRGVRPQEVVEDLDSLPPYQWDLLSRYWPAARSLGRKLQVFLSRGCPYHCTFCMERAKSGHRWRAFSPGRALEELERLASVTPLEDWLVNLADPLFGFDRAWRREVLQGIVERKLLPWQYWTLTRSDDLQEEDVDLLARARFSLGIGLESGSPRMLGIMQKTRNPERYLEAQRRLARLSLRSGLTWAANLVVGHPGETRESLQETLDFATELVSLGEQTCGWISVDPFRLYPGSHVHENRSHYEAAHGARFPHLEWWKHWFDGPFLAECLDPSSELDFASRVEFMHARYRPLVERVLQRFRGQGAPVDRVFRASIAEQVAGLQDSERDRLLALAGRPRGPAGTSLRFPVGLRVRDPRTRRREAAVLSLLERGVLRTERLVEALLRVSPEDFMGAAEAQAMLEGEDWRGAEGEVPRYVGLDRLAAGLEALNPLPGSRVADVLAATGYVSAVLESLVGAAGEVSRGKLEGRYDGLWLGAALPTAPGGLFPHLEEGGRLVTFLGPRFRAQDLVCLARQGDRWTERVVGRFRVPVLGGPMGWVPAAGGPRGLPGSLTVEWLPHVERYFRILARLDLGRDAANLHGGGAEPALAEAYAAAPGRLWTQVLPLWFDDEAGLLDFLDAPTLPALEDPGGRRLCALLAEAFRAEAAPADEAPGSAGTLAPLVPLREALHDGSPPPLRVLSVPSLATGDFTHGRATRVAGEGRIAVSFRGSPEHTLLQVLHEEVHLAADPEVLARLPAGAPDTRTGTPGFALHSLLEETAVDLTRALLETEAPHLLEAFSAWCGHFGV